jgi:hypothetical protein
MVDTGAELLLAGVEYSRSGQCYHQTEKDLDLLAEDRLVVLVEEDLLDNGLKVGERIASHSELANWDHLDHDLVAADY